MSKKISISRLANLFGAPRKTLNDWNNREDWRKNIIEVFQEIGSDKLVEILATIDEKKGIKRYTQDEIMDLFISIFSKLDLNAKYEVPRKYPFGNIIYSSKHKNKENTFMIYIFDRISFGKPINLEKYATELYNDALARGFTIEITVLTNGDYPYPITPNYVKWLNIRKLLDFNDEVIIMTTKCGGTQMVRY